MAARCTTPAAAMHHFGGMGAPFQRWPCTIICGQAALLERRTQLVYVSGLVLGLLSMVIALLGVAVLVTYSPQNGLILLVIAFLISPFGLPKLAFWLLGQVQGLKYAIQDLIYG